MEFTFWLVAGFALNGLLIFWSVRRRDFVKGAGERMKIQLRVDVTGMWGQWHAVVEVPELYQQAFEPLKTCDDALVAMATGDILESEELNIVMKTREDAAEILARELAAMIVSAMKRNDTHNGYRKET